MRKLFRLLLLLALLLFSVSAPRVACALIPKTAPGKIFSLAAFEPPQKSVQVPELHLDIPPPLLEIALGDKLWTSFDPEGLATIKEYEKDKADLKAFRDVLIELNPEFRTPILRNWGVINARIADRIHRIEDSASSINWFADLANTYNEANGYTLRFPHVDKYELDDGCERDASIFRLYDREMNVAGLAANAALSAIPLGELRIISNGAKSEASATEAGDALSQVRVNKEIGDATSDAIASRYPAALREVPFETVGGDRIQDVVPLDGSGIAIESKVGLTRATARVRQELARDWWLVRQGKLKNVVWEFTRSPITGEVGPTPQLLDKIKKLGLGVRINE